MLTWHNPDAEITINTIAGRAFKTLWKVADALDFHVLAEGFETKGKALFAAYETGHKFVLYPYCVEIGTVPVAKPKKRNIISRFLYFIDGED